jgi:hypothetical protein
MKELNTFQKYFVEEFYDDYREGLLSLTLSIPSKLLYLVFLNVMNH